MATAPSPQSFKDRRAPGSIRVQPGEFHVTSDPNLTVVTVLGSCVSACIRDPRTGFGGLNHFMLPESELGDWGGVLSQMRYGNHAMEALINAVLKSGCARQDLEIKLFGGANMYEGLSQVGSKNARFALDYLDNEGLRYQARDLGGNKGRRIHYQPSTGKVKRLFIDDGRIGQLTQTETRYHRALMGPVDGGDIELFGD